MLKKFTSFKSGYRTAYTMALAAFGIAGVSTPAQSAPNNTGTIQQLVASAPHLSFTEGKIVPAIDLDDWKLSTVSSVAAGADGTIYVLHRSKDFDPVVAMTLEGKVLHTWGKGLFDVPHSIRVDADGNVWTVDSGNSHIYKFSPEGTQLLHIDVGEIPTTGTRTTKGATDIAFASDGHLFISDGYGNARVLEYNAAGERLGQWGAAGTGAGEFDLVHGIAIDQHDNLYVADRENGRVHKFKRDGTFLGMWEGLGKVFSLFNNDETIWASTMYVTGEKISAYALKLGDTVGNVQGLVSLKGLHSITLTEKGDILLGAAMENVVLRYTPSKE